MRVALYDKLRVTSQVLTGVGKVEGAELDLEDEVRETQAAGGGSCCACCAILGRGTEGEWLGRE